MIRRRYPFRRGYNIRVPGLDDRVYLPTLGMVTIYTDQLEVELRKSTSAFFRSNLRYCATRVTQRTLNAIRVLVGFELIYHLLDIQSSINLFWHFYTIKKHDNDWKWFYFSSRYGSTKLIDVIFVSEKDFLREFWWKPISAMSDSAPTTLEPGNFEKIKK